MHLLKFLFLRRISCYMKFSRYILIWFSLFFSSSAFPQYSFTADTTEGCHPLDVTFSMTSTALIDTVNSVTWDFGNGSTGSGAITQTIYDTSGTYTLSMSVNGTLVETKNDYIRVHLTPRAVFSYTDTLGIGSYTVVLRCVAQYDTSDSFDYSWNLDGETAENRRTVIHTFPEAGVYPVGLTVTSSHGCADTSFRNVAVEDILEIPTFFSPNDDSYNDNFYIRTNGVTPYRLRIFSKSGKLIYELYSPTVLWDGRLTTGQKVSPGLYYFTLEAEDGRPLSQDKGYIMIFR